MPANSPVLVEALVPQIGISGLDPSSGWPDMEGQRSLSLGTDTRFSSSVQIDPANLAAHEGRLANQLADMVGAASPPIRVSVDGVAMSAADLRAVSSVASFNQQGKLPVVPHNTVTAISGTWTEAYDDTGNLFSVTRTAAAATEKVALDIPGLEVLQAAGAGVMPIGIELIYSVGTADVTDVDVEVLRTDTPTDGTTQAAITLSTGQTYDAAHDTAAERGDSIGAPEFHTMTIMFDQALAAVNFLNDGDRIHAELTVIGTITGVVEVFGWNLLVEKRLGPSATA